MRGERDSFYKAANQAAKASGHDGRMKGAKEEWLITLSSVVFLMLPIQGLARVSILRVFIEALHLHTDSIGCTSLQATFVVLFVE